MRRVLVIALALATVSLGGPRALAVSNQQEHYRTRWVNAFWHSRVRLDRTTFLQITWYAGAYDSGEDGFFSDLYRSVERCRRSGGGYRCRSVSSKSWYGYTTRQSGNTFTLDRRLDSAHLDATYRLYRYVEGRRILVGRFHVVADLTGEGDLARGRESYSTHEGCTTFSYSGRYEYRRATATGTLARGDGAARSLGSTRDANFGANRTVEIYHSC